MEKLQTSVITVAQLLQYRNLAIPVYQRPYKWTQKNINQLLKDIRTFKEKSAYRLGTIVIHDDGEHYNIVDGQQRVISLLLIIRAVIKLRKQEIKNTGLRSLLDSLDEKMFDPGFSNRISKQNIISNYRLIEREVVSFDEEIINFLLNRCEIIQFVLADVSEAFQFFDAQNARGRDLEPHDLLKAFHLREFSKRDEPVKTEIVNQWESMQTEELSTLFADFLFRVKSWSRMDSARFFTKEQIDLFKGINLDKSNSYQYTVPLRIAHQFVDNYNSNFERKVDMQHMDFPYQLDQTLINGRRFFEMISYYKNIYDNYKNTPNEFTGNIKGVSREILDTINDYEGRKRIGDTYVRMMFDCALLFYIDRFGYSSIDKAIEKIFVWAYTVRLNYQNVQLASVDNYVLWEMNLFRFIKAATTPNDFFSIELPGIERNYSTKTKRIEDLFKKLKYYGTAQE